MTEKHYRVVWEIDVEAETPEDAAERAREAQTNPDTLATVFTVKQMRKDGKTRKSLTVDMSDGTGAEVRDAVQA